MKMEQWLDWFPYTFVAGISVANWGIALAVAAFTLIGGTELGVTALGVHLSGASPVIIMTAVIVLACTLTVWMLHTPPVAAVFDRPAN